MVVNYIFLLLLIVLVVGSIKINHPTKDISWGEVESYSIVLTGDSVGSGHRQFKVVENIQEEAIAMAMYQGEAKYTGWSYLSINTSAAYNDSLQASSAGYLEGYLTYELIYNARYNYLSNTFGESTSIPEPISNWILETISFMKEQISNISNMSPSQAQYWTQISLTLNQIESMMDGFNDAVEDSNRDDLEGVVYQIQDLFLLNMYGDLFDLIPKLNLTVTYAYNNFSTPQQLLNYLRTNSHCSGMVKLTDDLSELYVGHTTWNLYYQMIRIFKSYYFSYSDESGIQGRSILFSSYPGVLISIDDFYQINTELVVLETTNNIIDTSLYDLLTPRSVLSWLRVMNANRMSTTGLEWCQIYEQYNSGTYNNQYMIVDYKKFTPFKSLDDGALYVLEQIPGLIEYEDVTSILRTGYWPSYNIPFFENIFNISGYPSLNISTFTYLLAPRSQIFRRQANDIYSLDDAKYFLRYNDYEYDPIAQDSPYAAIAARGDLGSYPEAFGGLDSKLTSYSLLKQNIIYAISGPTTVDQPPFDWNSRDWNYTHLGLIDYWDYQWVTFTNQTFINYTEL